jgi:hypothetical protein
MSGSDSGIAQVELREVLDQPREDLVALPRVAELLVVVEVDTGEHALERGAVVRLCSSAEAALLSTSPRLVAFLLDRGPPRARLGTKNSCSSGSSGLPPRRTTAALLLEAVLRRFRKSRPKMKFL